MTWRLQRLRTLLQGAWQHLHREGFRKTAARVSRGLLERVRTGRDTEQASDKTPANDGRPRILIVDAVMPDPSRDSGSLRLCNLMRILTDMGWRVDFMPDNLRADTHEKTILDALGVHTLCRPRVTSLADWLGREGASLGAVMLCRHYVAAAHTGLVRRYAPSARLLFDTVDLHHLREMREAEHAHASARQLRRIRRTRHQELDLVRTCDVTFVVSPMEKQLLERDVPEGCVKLLSNIHSIHPDRPGPRDRRDLMFVGGWGHPPNRDAITWLVRDIMPLLRHQLPDVRLHLVGDLPMEARPDLQQPGVCIHGRVPDLAPMMRQCRVALAPLRYGAGVKGKVNTAMSYGIPVVATPIAVEGMYLNHDEDVLVAETTEAFAAQIMRVYRDDALWQALSTAGMENIRQHFSFEAARRCLESVLARTSG